MSTYIAVAKFFVNSVEKRGYPTNDGPKTYQIYVKLSAVTAKDGDQNNENSKFWKASPGGQMELTIDNPDLFDAFEVGTEVYLPIIHANKTDLAAVSAAMQSLE